MSEFIIQCPNCGSCNKATTGLFAKQNIKCSCGYVIKVKGEKLKSRKCPHCGNIVVYDASKGDKSLCPVCKEKINTEELNSKNVDIDCPTCFCTVNVNKNASIVSCPICNCQINVQHEIEKAQRQKEGMIKVIKYEGGNDVFVWKYPIEDFEMGTQLIVHESQQAIFFKDGQALDTFKAGRYTLSNDNLPLISNLYKIQTNGKQPFHSTIYFVNLTTQLGIKWGTDSKVRMFDPTTNMHIELGACGQFNMQVIDARKFLIKVVGTTNGFNQNEIFGGDSSISGMNGRFKALIISKVKTNLAKSIKENNINILEIDENLENLSNLLKNKINENLDDYGLYMPDFYITSVLTPDDDPNFRRMKEQYAEKYLLVQQEKILQAEAEAAQARKLVEAKTAAQEEIIAAQASAEAYRLQAEAEAREMQMKGYTYQQETQRQVATTFAGNESNFAGTSSVVSDMVNLGIGVGMMKEVAGTVKDVINPVDNTLQKEGWSCSCGKQGITSNFCPNCGSKKPSEGWSCSCGKQGITSNFCPNCGSKKPSEGWSCSCGEQNIKTNFCPNCGSKKPSEGWSCSCGEQDIKTNFCPNCGSKKPSEGWTCECGEMNIKTNFCPNCGKKHE